MNMNWHDFFMGFSCCAIICAILIYVRVLKLFTKGQPQAGTEYIDESDVKSELKYARKHPIKS